MVNKWQFSPNLSLIPLGGIDNVTKNMFVYEFGHDIMLVDCGVGFPDEPSSKAEEELLLPDFTYILNNKDRVRGLIITHAHFDHFGAVPNLLSKINVPIYASRLTQEFIKNKLGESGIKPHHVDFRLIDEKDNNISIGPFRITPFHVNHSVPQALGLFIKTPVGNIFHVADYKFDWTPVDEEPFDIQKVSWLASTVKPVLLLSDCLGAAKDGHTKSESSIQEVFENRMIRAHGLVLVTTVSTNIFRIKQAIQASANVGRRVAFLGRSLEQSAQIARQLGYFSSLKKFLVEGKKIKNIPPSKLTIVVAGSYGQTDSALTNISQNKHHLVKLKKGDVVIFSADPSPPGVLLNVNNAIDNLTKLGAAVYYHEIQDNLHVSGHGTAEDIKMLMAIVKPKYCLPIGGDYRHMAAYQELAKQMGYPEKQVVLLKEKQRLEINQRGEIIFS
jgi:ribonuclease J